MLAPKLIETVEQIGLPCEVALQKGFEDVEDPRLTVGTVTVDGDRRPRRCAPAPPARRPARTRVELVRVGGGWRIASLGR